MADYLNFEMLQRYDAKFQTRISNSYYNKDEIDLIVSSLESNLIWKDAVATYADIATTYPHPQMGWTVTALDTNATYRYDGTSWVQISSGLAPVATSENDGLMRKEYVSQLDGLGTASVKNFTTTVDNSGSLTTASAVDTFVNGIVDTLSAHLEAEIGAKANSDDLGDAAGSNIADEIPEQKETVEFKGEWYSSTAESTFDIKGTGMLDGIDLTFVETVNNYTLHSNITNYSSEVSIVLYMSGTKRGNPVEKTIAEGQTFSINDVPDECLSGDSGGRLIVTIGNYQEGDIKSLNFFALPTIRDEANQVDIQLVKTSAYNKTVIHQEYDEDDKNHILYGNYGLYSSANLPTSSAVSSLVQTVVQTLQDALEAQIDELETKIDDYQEASDEDIEALFGDGSQDSSGDDNGGQEASDEDIENLFG